MATQAQSQTISATNGPVSTRPMNGAPRPAAAQPSPRPAGAPLPPLRRRPKPPADPLRRPAKKPIPKKPGEGPGPATIEKRPLTKVADTDDPATYHEYKLVTTKASLRAGLRYHCIKLHSNKEVNMMDDTQFTRPVRLHRRDPRAPQQGAGKEAAATVVVVDEEEKEMDLAEKTRLEAEAAAKEQQQKENLARIAPQGGAVKAKKNMFKKKTQQVFQKDEGQQKLRYEEFMPWMIEDFDNKNTWAGQLEGALSNTCVMLVLDSESGAFKMIPVEKHYRFQERNKFKTLTSEEAEAQMKKNDKGMSKWFMHLTKADEKEAKDAEYKTNMAAQKKLFTVKGDRLEGKEGKAGFHEADELDFEEDFADDEEAPIIEGDEEELKETTKKMKREQLSANIFDIRDEKEYEKEEKEKKALEKARKAQGKKVKKALLHQEKRFAYDESDSDANPYLSEDESEDEEEIERKKKEAEALKAKEEADVKETADSVAAARVKASGGSATPQPQSGTSPSATTPSSSTDVSKSKSLKRAGSPGIESGNESSHQQKKQKKSSQAQAATSNPTTTASAKPTGAPKKRKNHPSNGGGAGTGSEYETVAEMSDGAGSGGERKKQKKLNAAVPKAGTTVIPGKSRSASPAANPSRAVSPNAGERPAKKNKTMPTEAEVHAILKEVGMVGIASTDLSARFKGRLNKANKSDFIALLTKLTTSQMEEGKGRVFIPKPEVLAG